MTEILSFDKAMLSMVLTEIFGQNQIHSKRYFFNRDSSKYIQFLSLPQQIKSTKDPPWSELTVVVKNLMSSWIMIDLMFQRVAATLTHEYHEIGFRKHLY